MKIVVTGPFSSGKTTLIRTISQVSVIGTERDVTGDERAVKDRTTVAMDFGRVSLPGGPSLFLFGTPGQRRFEVMWEIVSEGMLGFVVLINAARADAYEEAAHILSTFERYADVPFVIGLTHLDCASASVEQVTERVRRDLNLPDDVDVVPVDPRDRDDVKDIVVRILLGVLDRIERAAAAS